MQGRDQTQGPQWGVARSNFPFNEAFQRPVQHNPFSVCQPGQIGDGDKQENEKTYHQTGAKPRRNETRDKLGKLEIMLTYIYEQTSQIIANQEQAAKREIQLLAYAEDAAQKQNLILQNLNYRTELLRGYQQSNYGYPVQQGQ